jgi:ankyrin repeat protein
MISAYSNMFNKMRSDQLINILEQNKSKANRSDYWERWKNLLVRDFPDSLGPEPVFPSEIAASDAIKINKLKAKHYEDLYRKAEIISYVVKINQHISFFKLFINHIPAPNVLNILSDMQKPHENGKEISPETMREVRSAYAEVLRSLASATQRHCPLHRAIEDGNKEVLSLLISAGADTAAPDEYNQLPIFYALNVQHINIDVVCILFADMYKNNTLPLIFNQPTLLDMIVRRGDIRLIKTIIEKYPDINSVELELLFHKAILANNHAVVRFFLTELKMDPNMLYRNIIPIIFIYLEARSKTVEQRGFKHDGYNPEDLTILDEFIQAGLDINRKHTEEVSTLLMYVACKNDLPAVKFLLEKGADANIMHFNGTTAKDHTTDREIKSILEAAELKAYSSAPKKIKLSN